MGNLDWIVLGGLACVLATPALAQMPSGDAVASLGTLPALSLMAGLWALARSGSRYAARRPVREGEGWLVARRVMIPLGLSVLLAVLLGAPRPAHAAPIISEVFYNPVGADNGLEWVELFNDSASPIDLAGYSLGWGGADWTTGQLQLAGSIGAGAYFVIGGPLSTPVNANPVFDQAVDLAPDLGNAPLWVANGVALFDQPAASVTPATLPVDVVLYGWPGALNWNGLIDETGAPAAVDVFTFAAGSSVEFTGAGWQVQVAPTPGGGPLSAPELSPAAGLLAGLAFLARRRTQAR